MLARLLFAAAALHLVAAVIAHSVLLAAAAVCFTCAALLSGRSPR